MAPAQITRRGPGPVRVGPVSLLVFGVLGMVLLSGITAGILPASSTHSGSAVRSSETARPQVPAPLGSNITSIPVGVYPEDAAFDTGNGYLYVANAGSDTVSVINGTSVVATVGVGSTPVSATYDGRNGFVYVSNGGSSNVTVINGTKTIGSVGVGSEPAKAAYDGRNGFVYVPVNGTNTVVVLNGTTYAGNVSVGSNPVYTTFDGSNGFVYAMCDYSNSVSVINGTSWIAGIALGGGPAASASYAVADGANGFVYVLGLGSSVVSVLNGTKSVASVNLTGLYARGAAYDPLNGYVYVPTSDGGNVTVINGTTSVATVKVGSEPYYATFDGGNGYVYVVNAGDDTVSVLNGTSVLFSINAGLLPWWVTYDGLNGYVYVLNGLSGNVTAISTPPTGFYPVTFRETGLAAGTAWSATLDGVERSSISTTISFREPNGGHLYQVGSVSGYHQNLTSGSVQVEGAGTTLWVGYALSTYSVAFSEEGLPSATDWSVTLGGATLSSVTSTIEFAESNGTYAYTVGTLGGWQSAPSTGSVPVTGHSVLVGVVWTSTARFVVTFDETGLAAGTSWSVQLSGASATFATSSIPFLEANGTYAYTVPSVPGYTGGAAGNLIVNGSAVDVSVPFVPVLNLIPLTFRTAGLATGTNWSVTLQASSSGLTIEAALTRWSDGAPTIGFQVSVGNYTYSTSLTGYVASSGSVTIHARTAASVTVPFVAIGPQSPHHSSSSAAWNEVIAIGVALVTLSGLAVVTYRSRLREVARGRLLVERIAETDWESDTEGESTGGTER
ncbi:MAG: YncE family protein [Thermoplasmata archaeon]|nr:YncE family protein [Thermoplasmata archaeon]